MGSATFRPPLAYGAVGLVAIAACLAAGTGVANAVLYVGIASSAVVASS